MMTRLTATSLILLMAAFLFSGCGEKYEAPAVEESSDVETSAILLDDGAMNAAVVVEKSTPESDLAFIAFTEVQTLTAIVVSIDLETRDVVLVGDDGVELELVVSEKALNLDQVSAGDTVNAQFIEQVTIQLVKGEELRARDVSAQREVQAAEGEMPARAEIQKTVDVYTIADIDLEANTFVLLNAAEEVEEFTANDPANLAKAAVGDSVVVTTTQAMAVEVVKATAE